MPKRVLDVGNCAADHSSIKSLIDENFEAEVVQAHASDEAIRQLNESTFDLVLVNRVFDSNGESGLDLIRSIAGDDKLRHTPFILITNYAEFQEQALQLGARPGFGKGELAAPKTLETLRQHL